jgi:hypothetical protein
LWDPCTFPQSTWSGQSSIVQLWRMEVNFTLIRLLLKSTLEKQSLNYYQLLYSP